MIRLTTLLLFLFSQSLWAQSVEESFLIPLPYAELSHLIKQHPELSVDHLTRDSFELYGPAHTEEWLRKLNIPHWREYSPKGAALAGYPSSAEINEQLQKIANKCSDFMRLDTFGETKEKRPLLAMTLSLGPQENFRPWAKYVANMHGNEIVGRELLMRFLSEICARYQQRDEEVLTFLNHLNLVVVPSLNPHGADHQRRGNSNFVDLNRNFPDFARGDSMNSTAKRELETIAMMNLQKRHPFVLSANFHGGAIVANYPWDTIAGEHTQNELIVSLARGYADHVPAMVNSVEFPGGIVNGYAWYEVNGGMQDWTTYWYDDLQITLEVSAPKWPHFRDIPTYYRQHRQAMFSFLALAHQGAGLRIDADRLGWQKGQIMISKEGRLIKQGLFQGSYYTLLSPGTYDVELRFANGQFRRLTWDVPRYEKGTYPQLQNISALLD